MREDMFERLCYKMALILIFYYIIVSLLDDFLTIKAYVEIIEDYDATIIWESMKYDILAILVKLAGAVVLMKFRDKGIPIVLAVCSAIIAFDCALEAYLLLIEIKDYISGLEFFLEGALSLIVSMMLFFNTIIFLRGLSKSVNLIKYGVLTLIILQLLAVITGLRSGESLKELLDYKSTLPVLLMLFLVLFMTSSKTIRQTSIMGSIGLSIRDMRNSLMEEGIGLDRPTASRFSDFNRTGLWCESYSFMMVSFTEGRYAVTFNRIGGKIVVNISSVNNHSGMNNFRFVVSGVWFDTGDVSTCDLMRFYSDDGMFIQVIVRDIPVPRPIKIPKIGAIVLLSKEVGTTSNRIRIKLTEFGYKVLDVVNAVKSKFRKKK